MVSTAVGHSLMPTKSTHASEAAAECGRGILARTEGRSMSIVWLPGQPATNFLVLRAYDCPRQATPVVRSNTMEGSWTKLSLTLPRAGLAQPVFWMAKLRFWE